MNASKTLFGDSEQKRDKPSIEDVIESLRDLDYRIEEIVDSKNSLPGAPQKQGSGSAERE